MVFEAVITSYVRLARNQVKYSHYPWLILMTTLIQELLYIILFIYKYFLHFQLFLNFIYKLCIGNWIEVKKKQQLDAFSENGKQIGYKIKFNIFITRQMVSFENLDAKEIQKLAIGAISILAIYCFSGIIHEYLIVFPYENIMTGEQEILEDRAILVFFPCLTTWLIGYFYNQRLPNPVKIPQKNSFYCGGIVFVSTITYTWAVAKTSFPVVMAFKSCNLLSVLLVAILCSRVKQKKLKLGGNKLLVGLTVTAGIFLFSFFDPQVQDRSQASQAIGIVLLTISLIADGFLPDFQAQIKSEYKPQPTQMMQQINKYVAVISLVSIFVSFSAVRVAVYVFQHPTFILHLVGMSLLSCAGQFVVYYMIKQFKQHIVPFIITLRKILTIVFSILFYNHATSNLQILGICIVAVAVIYEFASQIQSKSAHNAPATHGEKFQITQKHLDGCLDQENALVGVEKGNFKI